MLSGDERMRAGRCAGFPAGHKDGHQFANRSRTPAVYLEISGRDRKDSCDYPAIDLRWNAPGARGRYSHQDGRRY